MNALEPSTLSGPIDAEFTGAATGRRWAGGTVLSFVTDDGTDVALRLGEDDLADLRRMLHGWGLGSDVEQEVACLR